MATKTPNMGLIQPQPSDKVSDTLVEIGKSNAIIDKLFPVGIVLMFAKDVDPNDWFGRWTPVQGVYPYASSTDHPLGSTWGTETHSHRLPVGFDGERMYGYLAASGENNGNPFWGSEIVPVPKSMGTNTDWKWNQFSQARIAFSETASHLPPSKAFNYWERTA